MKLPLSIITIPDGRFRGEDEEIADLAASLGKFGLLQPIVVHQENGSYELIAGFRRLTAAKRLGWLQIEAVERDSLTLIQRKEIELEENIARLDMSWDQRVDAIAQIDKLKREQDPNWTQGQTAAVAGKTAAPRGSPDVSVAVNMARMIQLFPELRDAKSLNQARSWALSKASSVVRLKEIRDNPVEFQEISEKIREGDSVEIIKSLPSGLFAAIVTDSPFGIEYDRRKAGTEQSVTAYKDDEESYRRILGMAPDLFRVLREDAFLCWFLGPTWWWEAKRAFSQAGFTVDEIPVIWFREGGRGYTTRPDRYLGRIYDMALWCVKGNPEMTEYGRGHANVFPVPPVSKEDRDLLVERPVELYQEIIKCITVPGETVADFFVGSGSVPAAAASLRRDYFGVELDPERRAVALKKIKAHAP